MTGCRTAGTAQPERSDRNPDQRVVPACYALVFDYATSDLVARRDHNVGAGDQLRNVSTPAVASRSTVTPRLPAFPAHQRRLRSAPGSSSTNGGRDRCGDPLGGSTTMTSAPSSASTRPPMAGVLAGDLDDANIRLVRSDHTSLGPGSQFFVAHGPSKPPSTSWLCSPSRGRRP